MKIPAMVVAVALSPAFAQEVPPEVSAWVRERAAPIATAEAGNGFEDLAPLKAMVGGARIVSLGEPTHGTRECFQMKHRLMEFLASEMGFTLFSIEASMPEAFRLNEYVLEGKGDPAELIRGMHFWTWSTEEVLAMVEWMREFNEAGGAGHGPVKFTGFDMQFLPMSIQIAEDFLRKADPEFLPEADKAWADAVAVRGGGGGAQEFGVATGAFPVQEARGKRVRYSGLIKTEGVTQHAGLWWRVDGPNGEVLAFDNMETSGPRGDTGWAYYSLEVDVPPEATNINFGVIMPGGGTAWFDGLKVELDGVEYVQPALFDFTFEGPGVKGFMPFDGPVYNVGLDGAVAAEGASSLRIRRVGGPAMGGGAPMAAAAAERCAGVLAHLERNRATYLERFGAEEVDWAIQNARVVVQAVRTMANGTERDRAMAENVAWILDQNPGAKIVLWAHNGHVWRGPWAMGSYLEERFGDDHLAVGFATGQGEYTAVNRVRGGLRANPLAAPLEGSVEAICRSTGLERFVLDLRQAEKGSPASGWVFEERPFRLIGAVAMDAQFFPHAMGERFDLLVYDERTTAAVQLGGGK